MCRGVSCSVSNVRQEQLHDVFDDVHIRQNAHVIGPWKLFGNDRLLLLRCPLQASFQRTRIDRTVAIAHLKDWCAAQIVRFLIIQAVNV